MVTYRVTLRERTLVGDARLMNGMGKPRDELRKMLESTFNRACDDMKKPGNVLNADTPEKAAAYVLKEMENNLVGTGLPGDPPKPWEPMDAFERWKAIALWSIEKQFPKFPNR
jgi:hypothetical protein